MKRLIGILVLAFSLANLSAQSVYDMRKKDMITIINGTDSILVPTILFESYGSKCLEAYYNGSVEIEKTNNYVFSKWAIRVQTIEQRYLLVRNGNLVVDEFVVKPHDYNVSFVILLYIFIFLVGFLFFRNRKSNFYSILLLFGLAFVGVFIYLQLYNPLLFYVSLFVWGSLLGYLSKKIKITIKK